MFIWPLIRKEFYPIFQKCDQFGYLIIWYLILKLSEKQCGVAWPGLPSVCKSAGSYGSFCPCVARLAQVSFSRAIHVHSLGEGLMDDAGVSQTPGSGPGNSQYKMRKGKKTRNPAQYIHLIVWEKLLLGRSVASEASNSCWVGKLTAATLSGILGLPCPHLSLFTPFPFYETQFKYCPLPPSSPQHAVYLSYRMDQVVPWFGAISFHI